MRLINNNISVDFETPFFFIIQLLHGRDLSLEGNQSIQYRCATRQLAVLKHLVG